MGFLWLVLTLKILNHPLAMFMPTNLGRLVLAIRLLPTLETFNWHWLPLWSSYKGSKLHLNLGR